MKKAFAIVLSVLMMTLLLVGCGDKEAATPDSATPDSSSVSSKITETTKVIETTSEGGTVEQDKEGNVIEKDKSGEIVSVKDKDGKVIEITEYITTHTYVIEGSGDSSDSGSSDSGASSKSSDSGSQSSSKTDAGSKEDSPKATIPPEDMDEYELPII